MHIVWASSDGSSATQQGFPHGGDVRTREGGKTEDLGGGR